MNDEKYEIPFIVKLLIFISLLMFDLLMWAAEKKS